MERVLQIEKFVFCSLLAFMTRNHEVLELANSFLKKSCHLADELLGCLP
jgi:hypothetical protein